MGYLLDELRALGIQVGLWMIAAHDADEWCKTVKQRVESSRERIVAESPRAALGMQ